MIKKYILTYNERMKILRENFPELQPINVKNKRIDFLDVTPDMTCFTNSYEDIPTEEMKFTEILETPFLIFTGSNRLHNITTYYVWNVYKKQKDFDMIIFDAHLDLKEATMKREHAVYTHIPTIEYHNYLSYLLMCTRHKVNAFNIGSAFNENSKYRKETHGEREINYGFEDNYFVNLSLEWILEQSKPKIYLSIDLDCLQETYFRTDSSSGRMALKELEKSLKKIMIEKEVIGIDVCGFESKEKSEYMYPTMPRAISQGKEIITLLLNILKT